MIRKFADLAAAAIAAALIIAGSLVAVVALILHAPMASERKLAALWVLVCALVVAAGVAVVLAVQRGVRARRVTQEALRQACPHRQRRVLHGPLLVFGPREDRAPIDIAPFGAAHDDTVQLPGAAQLSDIPQQRRPRPRPEGETR